MAADSSQSSAGALETVEPAGGLASAICSAGLRPLWITGYFRDFLIRHFGNASQAAQAEMRGLLWHETPPTNILIESIYRYRPELAEMRPAILIKRNPYQTVRVGLGMGLTAYDRRGNANYADFVVGSHTLFCISTSASACEILATEVYWRVKRFGPAILRSLNLLQYAVGDVGEIYQLEESSQNYVVPIVVAWSYNDRWTLIEEARLLTTIQQQDNLQ